MNINYAAIKDPCLNLMLALPAEAKALIRHFSLQPTLTLGMMRLYQGTHLRLLITGAGERAMIKAFGFLEAQGIEKHHCFLNVGIAGGTKAQFHQLLSIHSISQHGQKNMHPSINPKHRLAALKSLSDQQPGHSDHYLTDHEGHAFFDMATRQVPQEQVALAKVVSDYDLKSLKSISAASIDALMQQQMPQLAQRVEALIEKSQQEANFHVSIDIQPFCQRWHFTHSQKKQLQEYLRRAAIHKLDDISTLQCARNAAEALKQLKHLLHQHTYNW